jgi:hypothetical protein
VLHSWPDSWPTPQERADACYALWRRWVGNNNELTFGEPGAQAAVRRLMNGAGGRHLAVVAAQSVQAVLAALRGEVLAALQGGAGLPFVMLAEAVRPHLETLRGVFLDDDGDADWPEDHPNYRPPGGRHWSERFDDRRGSLRRARTRPRPLRGRLMNPRQGIRAIGNETMPSTSEAIPRL